MVRIESASQSIGTNQARPLPRGEVRDIPDNAQIHQSAIRRLENNLNYRPGNLICGGGGRGYITAPKHAGIGEWRVVGEEGDVVGGRVIMVRRGKGEKKENGKVEVKSHSHNSRNK